MVRRRARAPFLRRQAGQNERPLYASGLHRWWYLPVSSQFHWRGIPRLRIQPQAVATLYGPEEGPWEDWQ